jgi:hypothetical protein
MAIIATSNGGTSYEPIPSVIWTYENFDATKFGQLPDYLKNKMVNSDEYKLAVTGGQEHESHNSNEVDDI